jgi:hypothetical protein
VPWPSRNYEEWKAEVDRDVADVLACLRDLDEADATYESRVRALAAARKEAWRLARDVERIGEEVFGIAREELYAVRL